MKSVQSSFVSTANQLLSSKHVSAVQVSISLTKHLGELFSFQLRSNAPSTNASHLHPQVLSFTFSRDIEIKSNMYEKYRDLSQDKVYLSEIDKISQYVTTKDPEINAGAKRRRVVDSDGSDDDSYTRQVKTQMPQASELCMIPDAEFDIDNAKFAPQKLNISSCEIAAAVDLSLKFTDSISAIKRPFSFVTDSHLDAVSMESKLKNPELAYSKEMDSHLYRDMLVKALPMQVSIAVGRDQNFMNQKVSISKRDSISKVEANVKTVESEPRKSVISPLNPSTHEYKCTIHNPEHSAEKSFDVSFFGRR